MVNINKRNNSTTVDELGLKYSLVRGRNESLKDFRTRIDKCISNTKNNYKQFERSLGYVTPEQDFDVFLIRKVGEVSVQINVLDTRLEIYLDEKLHFLQKLETLKFLKDFKAAIEQFDFLSIEVITDQSWEYLRTSNLIQCSTKRTRLDYLAESYTSVLPDKEVLKVQDNLGIFEYDAGDGDIVATNNAYALEGNTVTKNTTREEELTYVYSDFPLVVRWCPIRSFALNSAFISDVLKETIETETVFGIQTEEEFESGELEGLELLKDFNLVSQRGAKIINKILEKQNTYWGE